MSLNLSTMRNIFNKKSPNKAVPVAVAATAAAAIVGIAAVNGDYGNLFDTVANIITNFNTVAKLDTIVKVADTIINQFPHIDPPSHIGPRDTVLPPFTM